MKPAAWAASWDASCLLQGHNQNRTVPPSEGNVQGKQVEGKKLGTSPLEL